MSGGLFYKQSDGFNLAFHSVSDKNKVVLVLSSARAMKKLGEWRCSSTYCYLSGGAAPHIFTSALNGGDWSVSCFG